MAVSLAKFAKALNSSCSISLIYSVCNVPSWCRRKQSLACKNPVLALQALQPGLI